VLINGEDSTVTDAEKVSDQSVYTAEHVAMEAASLHAAEYEAHALVWDNSAQACLPSRKPQAVY
jgi:hypothetical protein